MNKLITLIIWHHYQDEEENGIQIFKYYNVLTMETEYQANNGINGSYWLHIFYFENGVRKDTYYQLDTDFKNGNYDEYKIY